MPFKRVPQKFNASIKEVTIGTGDKALVLGGESVRRFTALTILSRIPQKLVSRCRTRGRTLSCRD
jgi:acetyl-CoA decarbonylase/synthase complex subunit delta